jgi:spore maturation protein CgeB
LTQWAASSETFTRPVNASQRICDVSFVGRAFGSRSSQVKEIKANGIDIKCFGHGWDSGAISDDEMYKIMRESFISVNFANCRGGNQIKARTFEIPGSGGFLLTEYTPGLEMFYEIGKEIDVFHDTKELVEKINFYLRNPELRDAIAIKGFERTIRDHSYEKRVEDILNFAIQSKATFETKEKIVEAENKEKIEADFQKICESAKMTKSMLVVKNLLLKLCISIWGCKKGSRAARRIVYEISIKMAGRKTFTSSSFPARMFPGI